VTVTRLVGGRVVLPDAMVADLDIELTNGTISALTPPGTAVDRSGAGVLDVTGHLVAPGFVDLQINGGWGRDFTGDPAAIASVARHLPSTGVTAFLPTIVTSPGECREAAIRELAHLSVAPTDASPLGLHFEGPVIASGRRGAHDPRFIGMPTTTDVERWSADEGVLVVTLAPEVDGATQLIGRLVERGVTVAIGHTGCTAEQFAAARAAGATVVTHLFNAMAPFDHRAPGPIGATLADADVVAGLICDGLHVDPTAIRLAWNALGPRRTVLVTDAVAALGADTTADPAMRLGSLDVTVGPDGVRTAGGALAGSNLRLDDAVRNLIAFTGCTPAEALCSASTVPATAIGRTDLGRIEIGCRADLVVLDDDLHVTRTLIAGVTAWTS
jgi:N-acetylglucosamine-6-phosphate deacetylase